MKSSKNSVIVAVLMVVIFFCCMAAYAGGFGPDTGVLAKATFGNNGLSTPDVVTPSEYSYNPAVVPLALQLFQETKYAELDYGHISFDAGPSINTTCQYIAFQPNKKAGMRLARYTVDSGFASIAAFNPIITTAFSGQTYELTYGQFVTPKLSLGAAVLSEQINTHIKYDGVPVADASAKSNLNYRLGALYLIDAQTSFGAVFSRDNFEGKLEDPMSSFANYRETLWTVGVGRQFSAATFAAINYQKGKLSGWGIDSDFDSVNYSLKQFLNPRFCVSLSYGQEGYTSGVQYSNKDTTLGASYAVNGFHQVKDYFGLGDSFYFWVGRTF